jgi:hypothetical protein
MDRKGSRSIEEGELVVSREFQFITASLFKPKVRQRIKAEIAEDQATIYASFWQGREPAQTLRLFKAFKRYLFDNAALASYTGILKGYEIFQLGRRMGRESTYLYIARFMKKQQDASDRQICDYLDKCNSRLLALSSKNINDPKWARRPAKWDQKMNAKLKDPKVKLKFKKTFGDTDRRRERDWRESLHLIPGPVMTYLSRGRKDAKDAHLQNALWHWPRIVREHKKNARTSKIEKGTP